MKYTNNEYMRIIEEIKGSQHSTNISRRDVLRMLGAVGAMSAGPTAMLGSIERAFADEPSEPKTGGKIRVAGSSLSTADTLDPSKGAYSVDYSRHYMFYNGLLEFDENLVPLPSLATSVDSDDLVTWNIKLRKEVVFHDGKPFTADDVVYSLLRHKDPATGSKAKILADQFSEVTAISPHEVEIVLESANAELPSLLAVSHFLIIADGTTNFSTANGTGPFTCARFQPGIKTIAIKNPNYWKPGKPYLDEVELIGISDEPSRVNALLAGDIQMAVAVNPISARQIMSSGQGQILETNAGTYTDLIMRIPSRPFDNPDVVEGMKLLLDREQILKSVYLGFGTVANDHPIMPGTPYYFADLPLREYDPDKARFLFRKAGIENARLPIVTSGAVEGGNEFAVVYQQAARQAGLNLMINRVPSDGYWNNHWLKDPLCLATINGRPSANVLLTQFYKSDAAWNESGWENEQFDQLLVASRGEADIDQRKQMYADMQMLIHEHAGIGIPAFKTNLDAHSYSLKGLRAIPAGGLMGYMFAENVWLDS